MTGIYIFGLYVALAVFVFVITVRAPRSAGYLGLVIGLIFMAFGLAYVSFDADLVRQVFIRRPSLITGIGLTIFVSSMLAIFVTKSSR